MSDLRTGLVEAMGLAIEAEVKKHPYEPMSFASNSFYFGATMGDLANVALDAALRFLADNAEAWWQAWYESERRLYDTAPIPDHLPQLIAALSDSRDTGEKP